MHYTHEKFGGHAHFLAKTTPPVNASRATYLIAPQLMLCGLHPLTTVECLCRSTACLLATATMPSYSPPCIHWGGASQSFGGLQPP